MIDLIDVSKSYGPGLPAVNHANLHIDKGEFVFVVGNSGSGKTTLIKLLMKELDSTSGQIIVSGERLEGMKHRRVAKYRRKLGVVFQDFRLLKDRNVYENVAFAQRVVMPEGSSIITATTSRGSLRGANPTKEATYLRA